LDGVKLIFKEESGSRRGTTTILLVALGLFMLALVGWTLPDSSTVLRPSLLGGLGFLGVLGLLVYALLTVGTLSAAAFSVLGGVRASSQSISYEVAMALSLLGLLVLGRSFVLAGGFGLCRLFLSGWAVCVLAESNRAPIDFAEGESELISGFNLETGGVVFTLLFLGEYASLLFLISASCTLLCPAATVL
jgi:NADH-ubiquinone oxidoreductase chain 1